MPTVLPDATDPQWIIQMRKDKVFWLHGSNSSSLEGVAKFRALLSMEKIHGTPWFFRNGSALSSGERLYTMGGPSSRGPVGKGVSLLEFHRFYEVLRYSLYGTGDGSSYPIVYGLRNVRTYPYDWHSVSEESINIDSIAAIYVPSEREAEAKSDLLNFGNAALSHCVKGLIALSGGE